MVGPTPRNLPYLLDTYTSPEAHDPGWLFGTSHGYGQVAIGGKVVRVHNYVCELVHGPRPSPAHVARHSCARNRACYWAEHVAWRTKSENQRDRAVHDLDLDLVLPTQRHFDLTLTDWRRIRLLRASGTTVRALSQAWEITPGDVRYIIAVTSLPDPVPPPDRPEPYVPEPSPWGD